MPYLTISQLNRITGKSRVTITNWVKTGKISCTLVNNVPMIDVAEACRVFGDLDPTLIEQELSKSVRTRVQQPVKQDDISEALQQKIDMLEQQVAVQAKMILLLEQQIQDLKGVQAVLVQQLHAKDDQLGVLGRLLPQQSTATVRKSGNWMRPRDSDGRFIKGGQGVKALITDGE